jgi:hypothetical protein
MLKSLRQGASVSEFQMHAAKSGYQASTGSNLKTYASVVSDSLNRKSNASAVHLDHRYASTGKTSKEKNTKHTFTTYATVVSKSMNEKSNSHHSSKSNQGTTCTSRCSTSRPKTYASVVSDSVSHSSKQMQFDHTYANVSKDKTNQTATSALINPCPTSKESQLK